MPRFFLATPIARRPAQRVVTRFEPSQARAWRQGSDTTRRKPTELQAERGSSHGPRPAVPTDLPQGGVVQGGNPQGFRATGSQDTRPCDGVGRMARGRPQHLRKCPAPDDKWPNVAREIERGFQNPKGSRNWLGAAPRGRKPLMTRQGQGRKPAEWSGVSGGVATASSGNEPPDVTKRPWR